MTSPVDARRARAREVLEARMGWLRCAVEAVYHRHNVSAILRTCDSLGLQHVHLVEGHLQPVGGAARGADRWLDLHWEPSGPEAVARLQAEGFAVWVADFAEDPVPPEAIPIDRPVCLWMGAELQGVHPEVRARADGVMTIPMRGFSQSLNVSVAAAMALYALATRIREAHGRAALLSDAEREALWERWMHRELVGREPEASP
jgi:tRNA (guanosine-2'-O-)-methyltransferase